MYSSKSIFLSLKSRKMSQKIPTLVLGKEMKRKVTFDLPASGSVANEETLKPPREKKNQGNFDIYKHSKFRIFPFSRCHLVFFSFVLYMHGCLSIEFLESLINLEIILISKSPKHSMVQPRPTLWITKI